MRYIKATYYGVFKTDDLTKEDLVRAKQDSHYQIINRIEETYYDAEANEWKPIKDLNETT